MLMRVFDTCGQTAHSRGRPGWRLASHERGAAGSLSVREEEEGEAQAKPSQAKREGSTRVACIYRTTAFSVWCPPSRAPSLRLASRSVVPPVVTGTSVKQQRARTNHLRMEMMTSAWRSLMYGAGAAGSAAADVAAGRKILEKIQLALLQAFQKHGAHALSADEIAPIKVLCDQLLPAHFQLSVPNAQAAAMTSAAVRRKARRVRYQHIWEDDKFSMGIFILPPGASIPLHDHPEMSVISRVLYGNLHVKACDIVPQKEAAALVNQQGFNREEDASSSQPQIVARMCANQVITAPYTTELLPDRGNLHEFVAGNAMGCAIFDILTPPYEPDDGRDCTYYRFVGDARASAGADDGALVALEIFDPEDFEVASEPYLGPRLAPHVNAGAAAPGVSTASSSSSMSSMSSSPSSSGGPLSP